MFEPPQRNSGILGGKFLERGRIKKPDGVSYFVAPVSKVFYFCVVFFLFLFRKKNNKDFLRLVLGSLYFNKGVCGLDPGTYSLCHIMLSCSLLVP